MFLECAWEALEHAGCDPARYAGNIGVVASCSLNTYLMYNVLATRAAVNASPEPFSNWGLSLAGDALVPSMLWLVWRDPVLAALVLGLLTLAMLLLLWRLAWHLRALAARLRRALSGAASDPVSPP